jgi:beta-glucosidase
LSKKFTRRTFVKLTGATALASATELPAFGSTNTSLNATTAAQDTGRNFPPGFLWGTATASYQIEGAVKEDGRGPSIWDTFSHTPGKVVNNANGDVANNHYHLYKSDVQLMKALGTKAYRFSIAWPRVFPNGDGPPNPKGLDFYNRLVDELLANGIQPYATLYHWDLPQSLQDRFGGWEGRDTANAFADYAGYVAERLSDRVKNIFTMNELSVFTDVGYRWGIHAPGLKLEGLRLNQLRHHAVLGHGLAVQAIRASAKSGTKVGLAENITIPVPVVETPQNIAAAERAMREMNAPYLTVIMEGKYTDWYLKSAGADAPKFTPEDLKAISSPLDFVGVNIYTAQFVRADESSPTGYTQVPHPKSFPHAPSFWLFITPDALYWGPRHVAKLWKAKEIYITESGCSAADEPATDGKVYDTDRVTYLRSYLTQLRRATADNVPVRGYFLWSLMDNFEWADGYTNRFGIHYNDYATQKRTPKLSADFYREVIARNAVV